MKTKFLKMVRERYEYQFIDGKIYTRCKQTGSVSSYNYVWDFYFDNVKLIRGFGFIPRKPFDVWVRKKKAILNKRKWDNIQRMSSIKQK